jgi:hypothetical protein
MLFKRSFCNEHFWFDNHGRTLPSEKAKAQPAFSSPINATGGAVMIACALYLGELQGAS